MNAISVGVAPTRIVLAPSGDRAWARTSLPKTSPSSIWCGDARTGSIAMEGDPLGAGLSPDGRILYVTTNLDRLCACALVRQQRPRRPVSRPSSGVR